MARAQDMGMSSAIQGNMEVLLPLCPAPRVSTPVNSSVKRMWWISAPSMAPFSGFHHNPMAPQVPVLGHVWSMGRSTQNQAPLHSSPQGSPGPSCPHISCKDFVTTSLKGFLETFGQFLMKSHILITELCGAFSWSNACNYFYTKSRLNFWFLSLITSI